jgi:hypothetical protein
MHLKSSSPKVPAQDNVMKAVSGPTPGHPKPVLGPEGSGARTGHYSDLYPYSERGTGGRNVKLSDGREREFRGLMVYVVN